MYVIQDQKGPYRTIRDHTGPCRAIGDHKGPYWTIPDHKGAKNFNGLLRWCQICKVWVCYFVCYLWPSRPLSCVKSYRWDMATSNISYITDYNTRVKLATWLNYQIFLASYFLACQKVPCPNLTSSLQFSTTSHSRTRGDDRLTEQKLFRKILGRDGEARL